MSTAQGDASTDGRLLVVVISLNQHESSRIEEEQYHQGSRNYGEDHRACSVTAVVCTVCHTVSDVSNSIQFYHYTRSVPVEDEEGEYCTANAAAAARHFRNIV